LVYFEGDPADQTIGLELIDPDDLDAVGAALEQAGRPVHFGTREECDAAARVRSSPRPIPAATSWKSWRARTTAASNTFPAARSASPISATSHCSAPIPNATPNSGHG